MKTIRLTMAQAIVQFLKAQYVSRDGVEHRLVNGVFGIFGHGNVTGLGQALEEYGGKDLPFHQPKNEQAMVHTAVAFSKARHGLGTYACTTSVGPGATNLVTGAATATINRIPVLLLPGDIFSNRMPAPVLQQLEVSQNGDMSVNDCFKPVSRYWDRMNRPEQILRALPEAMRHLATPELYGAVTICLPQDVQAEAYEYPVEFFEKRVYQLHRRSMAETEIIQATEWIRQAKRPMIIAGGGVFYSEAGDALRKWAEQSKMPVGTTQAGTSSFPPTSFHLGGVGVTGSAACNEIASKADLVIAIGTRFSDFTTASKSQFQAASRFISINLNPIDAYKQGSMPLVGDVREVIRQLATALGSHRTSEAYEREIMAAQEKWRKLRDEMTHPKAGKRKLHQAEVIRVLNTELDANSTIVHAAGGLPGDLHKLWEPKAVGDYHSEYGYSCMGYEIAGALGVKLAEPKREVYAVLGDGSYLMLNHEIMTSIQENRKFTVVLLDNHGYQCIHNLQRSQGSKGFGNEFRDMGGETLAIDYMANAKSLGAVVFRADTEADLLKALAAARKETRTCLIYIPIEANTPLPGFSWWDVPVAEVSGMKSVNEAREKYLEALKQERFHH